MYMNQSMESFENWRDSLHDRPEPDTEAPDEQMVTDAEHAPNKPVVWKPIEAEKADWLYSGRKEADAESGCIGHLRGDFGRSGTEFWTSWFDHSANLNNEEFRKELQAVVDSLRNEGGLLSGFSSMRKGCCYDGAIGNGHYGYRAETSQYEYCLRCIPQRGDYNFYLYCYDKEAQRAHSREQKAAHSTPVPTIKPKKHEMER